MASASLSGWVCAADEVEIALGDRGRQGAAYGTERRDTESEVWRHGQRLWPLVQLESVGRCGSMKSSPMWTTWSWGRATVRVTTLGEEFVRGVEGECVVEDFPGLAKTVTLEWHQNSQNFVMTAVE